MTDKLIRLTVQIPESLHQAAKIAAVKQGTTLREMVIAGLKAQVKKGGRA